MNWIEALKFVAAGTAIQCVIWAYIFMRTPKWPPHEVKPVKLEDYKDKNEP